MLNSTPNHPLHNLSPDEILNLKQVIQHPGFAALNKLLLYQVDSATADFVGRELIDSEEIVNRYKDFRGVHKAIGETLNTIRLIVQEDKIENVDPEAVPNPYGFDQIQ